MYGASTEGPEDEGVTTRPKGREWYEPSAAVAAGLARTRPAPQPSPGMASSASGQPTPPSGSAEGQPAPHVPAEWGANADISEAE
eukprot:6427673-Alexandrium_andersonii.AAC.1